MLIIYLTILACILNIHIVCILTVLESKTLQIGCNGTPSRGFTKKMIYLRHEIIIYIYILLKNIFN